MESAERGSADADTAGPEAFDEDTFGPEGFDPEPGIDPGIDPGEGSSGRVIPEPDPNQPVPGIDTSLQSPAPLGTPRDVGDGWTVTVESFNATADAEVESASDFYQPPAQGKTYAIVTITGRYDGDGTGSSMDLDFELVGPTGVAYPTDFLCSLPDDWMFMDDTASGATSTGRACFQVPVAEVDATVLVVTPFFRFDGARTFMALR